eukprot:jgi/Bigna1/131207/aug1.13_g5915
MHIPRPNPSKSLIVTDDQGNAYVFSIDLKAAIVKHHDRKRSTEMDLGKMDLGVLHEIVEPEADKSKGAAAGQEGADTKSNSKFTAHSMSMSKGSMSHEAKKREEVKKKINLKKGKEEKKKDETLGFDVILLHTLRRTVLRHKKHSRFWEARYMSEWSFVMHRFFNLNITKPDYRKFLALNRFHKNEEGSRQKLRWLMLSVLSLPLRVPIEYADRLQSTVAEGGRWKPAPNVIVRDRSRSRSRSRENRQHDGGEADGVSPRNPRSRRHARNNNGSDSSRDQDTKKEAETPRSVDGDNPQHQLKMPKNILSSATSQDLPAVTIVNEKPTKSPSGEISELPKVESSGDNTVPEMDDKKSGEDGSVSNSGFGFNASFSLPNKSTSSIEQEGFDAPEGRRDLDNVETKSQETKRQQ